MPDKAQWWRPDGGYQETPTDNTSASSDLVQQPPIMFCNPVFLPQQPQTYLEGPIPVDGVVPFSPVPGWGCTPPPPYPQVCYPVPPCPQRKEKTETGESDGSSKDQGNQAATKKKKTNLHQPPKLPAGVGYLFDKESNHTMLHVFSKAAPIWKDKYTKESLKFKKFKVSVNFTVKMVIENVIQKDGEGCKSWAITEAIEDGDGTWRKGSTIEHCSSKASGTLDSMGWSSKRGDSLPPVWLVVHKVGKS